MKIYLVGGAVRDKLLGLPVKERDWVVVGATVQDMLAAGYKQVGKEFPVFLHPKTTEEYALARMERKVGAGYKGFTFDTSPNVSLEEDLLRRDLTINAMAETSDGEIIDPYHGRVDLDKKLLRHVSAAFAEDPVRILRIGRFLARYAYLGFQVAPETLELMRSMVKAGEVNALVAERVWKELERALGERNPEEFFIALASCGALTVLFPQLNIDGAGMNALKTAVTLTPNPAIRFAALLHDLPEAKKEIGEICQRYRLPNAYAELAKFTATHYQNALNVQNLSASELISLFYALDIFRREDRFLDFVATCKAIALSRSHVFDADLLIQYARIARSVNVQELLTEGYTGSALGDKLKEIRTNLIIKHMSS